MIARSVPHRAAELCWSLVCSALLSCSSQTATPQPPAASPAAAADAAAAAPSGPRETVLEPPDGKWLIDEEGRQYFVLEVPKYEGNYLWLEPDKKVQLRYGAIYDVVSHDADSFSVKIYKVPPPPPAPARPEAPRSEARAPIATAKPRSATGMVDRVEFVPFDRGLPTEGQWRHGFELADMNGDGHLDIVHGPARKGPRRPNIFLGDGAGGWRSWSEARFPSLAYDYGDVAVADFNGDGRLDLALAMHLRGLVVLVASGASSYELWSRGLPLAGDPAGAPINFSSRALAAIDWNGDGRVDLAALGEGPVLSGGQTRPSSSFGLVVFFNGGDGTWTERHEIGAPRVGRHFGDGLAVGDLDGDGKPDAALSSSVIGEKMILRYGDGSGWSASHIADLPGTILVNAVEMLDIDRDGSMDLVIGYQSHDGKAWRSGVDLYYGQGDAAWKRRELWVEDGRRGVFALASGDLDGDGRADLAALTGDGRTLVFLDDGAGFYAQESSAEVAAVPERCKGFAVKMGDLDGDGREDLVTAFSGESSALFDPEKCRYGGRIEAWRSSPRRR